MSAYADLRAFADKLDALPDRARAAIAGDSFTDQAERDRVALALLDQFIHIVTDCMRGFASTYRDHTDEQSNANISTDAA
jgi:hypothetical protein